MSPDSTSRSDPPSQDSGHPLAVLLVEDDEDHVLIARHHIRKLGDRVGTTTRCDCLEDARAALAKDTFDVILLDLTLPDSPLDDTVTAIKDLAKQGAPIVAMSSLDLAELRARTKEMGAHAFLGKGVFDSQSLEEILDDLGRPAAVRESTPSTASAAGPLPPPSSPEPERVASKLVHDASSWIASATFRAACLRPALGDDPALISHLESIESSLRALTSIARGARHLVIDESAPLTLEAIELGAALPDLRTAPSRAPGERTADLEAQGALPTVLADRVALTKILDALLENSVEHGEDESPVLRAEDASDAVDGTACLRVSGDGTWSVERPESLGQLGTRGSRRTPSAGLGLYRVRQLMEAMGGAMEIESNDEGAPCAVRLTFQRP